MPLDTNGWQEPSIWKVLAGAFTLASVVQGFKIAANRDNLPPWRVLIFQSLLAGLAALTVGFYMIDKWTVSWKAVLFMSGVVGWMGGEALGLIAGIVKREAIRRARTEAIADEAGPK